MTIGSFVKEEMGLDWAAPALDAVSRFAGEELGNTSFYPSMKDAVEHIEPWMPIYFLPIGDHSGFYVGLHFRPSDITAKRMAIVRSNEDAEMIEIANSFEHYAYLCVAQLEGAVNEEGPLPDFDESVSLVNGVFGKNFYEPGRHGDFGEDDIDDLSISEFGGSAHAFHMAAFFEQDMRNKITLLKEGIKVEPRCLHLHASVASIYQKLDEIEPAAQAFMQSAQCLRHTAYHTDLEEYRQLGRSLLDSTPKVFNEDARLEILIEGDKERLQRVMDLYETGRLEYSTKLLCDMCHDFGDYSEVLEILKKHYSRLEWDWALALCELRR